METHPIRDPHALLKDGSNADVNIDIGVYDFSAADITASGTITDGTFAIIGGVGTGLVSLADGVASWLTNSLSGFTSISGTTLTDGVLSITGGNLVTDTGTIDCAEVFNANGNLKIQPDGTDDVTFFEDEDIGGAVEGNSLRVYRVSSADGSTVDNIRFYLDQSRQCNIRATRPLQIWGSDTNTIYSSATSWYFYINCTMYDNKMARFGTDNDFSIGYSTVDTSLEFMTGATINTNVWGKLDTDGSWYFYGNATEYIRTSGVLTWTLQGGAEQVNVIVTSNSSDFLIDRLLLLKDASDTLGGAVVVAGETAAAGVYPYGALLWNAITNRSELMCSSADLYIEAGTSTPSNLLVKAVNVGIGATAPTPTAQLHVDQSNAAGAKPVLRLDQGDIDDSFIDFIGTSAADGSRSISSDTTEDSAKFGAIQIEINGVTKWIRIYDDES